MRLAASVIVVVGCGGFALVSPVVVADAVAGQAAGAPDPVVVATAEAFTKAVAAKDAKAVAALYVDDGIEMPPNRPAIKGKAAIEEYYAKLFNGPGPILEESTSTHLEGRVSGDMAIDVGNYRDRIKLPDGNTINAVGKYIVVMKRVGEAWKVAYAIYNGDEPERPAPPPPPMSPPPLDDDDATAPKPPKPPKPPMPPPPPPPARR